MVTGVWKGRMGKQKVEVKIIQKGDSLTGTSYYYDATNNYRRYSIKGYFEPASNAVVWWDDQLIEEKSGRLGIGSPGKVPLLSRADFNCPGGGVMMLDGTTAPKEDPDPNGSLHLDKISRTNFRDEWDYVIDNYIIGANHPDVIDSVGLIASRGPQPRQKDQDRPAEQVKPPKKGMVAIPPIPSEPVAKADPPKTSTSPEPVTPAKPVTIEEKFVVRKSKFVMDIPLVGDSLELRFYDNAEIDGDSISLFLNQKMIFSHIRLTGKPYMVKLPITELYDTNELVMVAENLGRIPPNTSYMIAIVGEKRYEANLESTEEISAMIRLTKPKKE
jgi:hypothetical protein